MSEPPRPEESLRRVATFCGHCSCGCPELVVDPDARGELLSAGRAG